MADSADPPAALFVYADRIVWASTSFTGGVTTRPCAALLIGTERPLTITAGGRTLRSRAVLVGPHVSRSLLADRAGFYSLTLDPAHPASRRLRDVVLAGRPLLDLSDRLSAAAIGKAATTAAIDADCASSFAASEWLLAHFFSEATAAAAVDPRVLRVAARLRAQLPARVDLAALAALCQLSPGRLTHLFTAELGVSIRSYLRWVKMSKAIELLGSRQTVTDVAATIGFADAAHFTRVLRSYYSAAPSMIIDPALVRVCGCAETAPGAAVTF